MPERIEINPGWEWTTKYRITPAVKVGSRVYTSGLVALDAKGKLVGEGDVGAQARHTFANIREVLAAAGASMDDVVKITTYLTDMSRYREFAEARAEAFPDNIPASTTIAVPALVLPELLVEIEAVAEIGSGGS